MPGLSQLSKLTSRAVPLNFSSGGASVSNIAWDDVAGAMAGLPPQAYWYARAVFCRDNHYTKTLQAWITEWVLQRMTSKGAESRRQTIAEIAAGISMIALFGECWCRPCTHPKCVSGSVITRGKLSICPTCRGAGRVGQSLRQKISVGGLKMTPENYSGQWRKYEFMVLGLFKEWRAVISEQLNVDLSDDPAPEALDAA